ncbi:hypothetical protein PHYBOEH_009674 [Phytophthora boehmeriae]|uniref:Uncharacterized protein n=1 Tax=Phytophthora boehmeriae TaxID=109152 RepID=A0A8T1VS61_9STRA|nr:hypothetical protein PHYBOEH_009674 [Phytophthora boehmeriae]
MPTATKKTRRLRDLRSSIQSLLKEESYRRQHGIVDSGADDKLFLAMSLLSALEQTPDAKCDAFVPGLVEFNREMSLHHLKYSRQLLTMEKEAIKKERKQLQHERLELKAGQMENQNYPLQKVFLQAETLKAQMKATSAKIDAILGREEARNRVRSTWQDIAKRESDARNN